MSSRALFVIATLAGMAASAAVNVVNNCSASIDPAFFPAANGGLGGFTLAPGDSQSVTLPAGYNGNAWGRTGCDDSGSCATGSCSGGINCTAPAAGGATLAQFQIDIIAKLDFFSPKTDDGFNIAVNMAPIGCPTAPVACTDASGDGDGCDVMSTCPTGTDYTLTFC